MVLELISFVSFINYYSKCVYTLSNFSIYVYIFYANKLVVQRRWIMSTTLKYVTGLIAIILIWSVISLIISSDLILPSPVKVFQTIINELSQQRTWAALGTTLAKVGIVMLVTVIFGVFFGFLIGLSNTLYDVFRPAILIMQAIPIITWLALVMFIWGIGWTGPVVVSILALLPQTILSTAIGVQTTDKRLTEVAKVYNVNTSKVIRDIYFGSIIPQIIGAIQVVIGNVWKVVVVSEYMCGDDGIGVLIAWARQSVAANRVYAYTFIVITIGLIAENLVHKYTKRLLEGWEAA